MTNLPADRLHFGSKGGFTGEFREYILSLDNGLLLFKEQLPGSENVELKKIGKIKKQRLKSIHQQLEKLDFKSKSRAANMNAMLTYHHGTEQQSLQWPAPDGAPTKEVQTLFEFLMEDARNLRSKKTNK